jgi:hypothetical protein
VPVSRRLAAVGEIIAVRFQITMEGDMTRLILLLAVFLTACTSTSVRCDMHLQPINPPKPAPSAP